MKNNNNGKNVSSQPLDRDDSQPFSNLNTEQKRMGVGAILGLLAILIIGGFLISQAVEPDIDQELTSNTTVIPGEQVAPVGPVLINENQQEEIVDRIQEYFDDIEDGDFDDAIASWSLPNDDNNTLDLLEAEIEQQSIGYDSIDIDFDQEFTAEQLNGVTLVRVPVTINYELENGQDNSVMRVVTLTGMDDDWKIVSLDEQGMNSGNQATIPVGAQQVDNR